MKNAFVYFLLKDDIIVYVGSTVNPVSRLRNHLSEKYTRFDHIALAYIGNEDIARDVEKLCIFRHAPVLNKTCKRYCAVDDYEKSDSFLDAAYFIEFSKREFEIDNSIVFDVFTIPIELRRIREHLPKSRRAS